MDFFNDLGKMINQAARSISARPREEAAPVQVHTFGVAEVELNRRLAELGSAYYQVTIGEREKVDPVLIERVREARETLDALAATAEAQTLRCPFCGAAQLAGARFCSSCGKPLPKNPTTAWNTAPNAAPSGETANVSAPCAAARSTRRKPKPRSPARRMSRPKSINR